MSYAVPDCVSMQELMGASWNVVYPLYFDAKVSINSGRRVPRTSAVWWPIATQIAEACKSLGLPSVLEVSHVSSCSV